MGWPSSAGAADVAGDLDVVEITGGEDLLEGYVRRDGGGDETFAGREVVRDRIIGCDSE